MNWKRKKKPTRIDPYKNYKTIKLKNVRNVKSSSFRETIAKSNGMYFLKKISSFFKKKKPKRYEHSNQAEVISPKAEPPPKVEQVTEAAPVIKETVADKKQTTNKNTPTKKTEKKQRKNKKSNRQVKKNKRSQQPSTLEKAIALDTVTTPEIPIAETQKPSQPVIIDEKPELELPRQIKIVITGSVGAGKTTAIFSISDVDPITTESPPTDDVKKLKSSTTTSMDYGSFTKFGSKVHVYGTPGQKRFSFMSEVLTKGAGGLIILISNNQDDPVEELEYYLDNNKDFLTKNPAVIGITHIDESTKNISIYTDYIKKKQLNWPIVPVDARNANDVLGLIDQVIEAKFGKTS